MPGFIARKLCPELVFVNCNFEKYEKVSDQIRGVIAEYDPDFRSHSLDEVYFDLTDAARCVVECADDDALELMVTSSSTTTTCFIELIDRARSERNGEDQTADSILNVNAAICSEISIGNNDSSSHISDINNDLANDESLLRLRRVAFAILNEIRQRITTATGGLTCSAGLANNHLLAKICAEQRKPCGQFALAPRADAVRDFVAALPARRIGGVGHVTEKILSRLGLRTMGDVRAHLPLVAHSFTRAASAFLTRACIGISEDEIREGTSKPGTATTTPTSTNRKSIGSERTFSALRCVDSLFEKLHELCENVATELQQQPGYILRY
jgi:DNA polymerase kappa